ncbi:enoyl-CoA hydratase [Streptoalloteichus tenebrarius]|uniref:3-hydroxyisobutyryl-CoA hydrolase n=1 Tax=Streptoalloteichus tenebrarius (strain ATCC 17920 / DSM 40477 / JCM 4838 / CBS 697.72 / NBRC 16177 / NCIMB 11028 / NRRL B-12390 / A12253. 1 / ISP 5477) TaxID=1933 RepID=A0ABT1I310_STRSD|nr:enoyl-CoA hydratase/isomerase family protein [Streptoalloteichus tenebrarius]MCP2262185.1 enoyl-CoA hydratase [Streptoalloteichus tenebrarius]BFE98976.1 enoyl-CoA hydratase/isomerase family protein [Streptoalloteichus tenebrarius]
MTEVDIRVERGVGRITLNRPKAINALTHGMVRLIDAALVDWAADDAVRLVVVDGAGERGLCAGGDIRSIYEDARAGGTASLAFWADEYRMNARIARFPKPYLAFMDGVVMGGGVGVSSHGTVRVVTERTRLAMPEVGIGLVPDVGGTYLLSRAPGELGTFAALTGTALSAADAIHCGLADLVVPSDRLPALLADLLDGAEPEAAVATHARPPGESRLAAQADWIDACFAADRVEEILARLTDHGEDAVAKEIEARSPTALKVTLAALRRARDLPDLESVLEQEYRVSAACLRGHDLAEGIRAQIIDKDRNPRWSPATLSEVDDDVVAAHFAEPEIPFRLTGGHS